MLLEYEDLKKFWLSIQSVATDTKTKEPIEITEITYTPILHRYSPTPSPSTLSQKNKFTSHVQRKDDYALESLHKRKRTQKTINYNEFLIIKNVWKLYFFSIIY